MLCALVAVAWAAPAKALDLLDDYQKALAFDPTYRTAEAQYQSNLAGASEARVAYLPTASVSNQRLDTDTNPRQTYKITQPIIDLARIAAWRQAEPRQAYAEATLLLGQQDLAIRLLKAGNAIILANENLKLNQSKIEALNTQALAAKRKLELGQGTVTDMRDIDVKAAQARAQQLNYKSALDTAVKQYAAIVGETPSVAKFELPVKSRKYTLLTAQQYVDDAMAKSPTLQVVRYNERLAELEIQKNTGSLLPVVSATYSSTTSNSTTNSYTGVVVSMPLQVSSYYARKSVEANFIKAQEAKRDVEQKVRLDVERLTEQVSTGLEALDIQKDAIGAAELSLEANQKSYEGGVRSTVDVLNATQTLFQVKSDYVTTASTQAENLLGLALQTVVDPQQALRVTARYLSGD